ncbi:hypothetical protein GCM10011494_30390 [Novosphingobium endophyticum]|uniref:Uncharacterized protein n=1 Tax=Novosphingobium endophyticum TaxID=1955250 RepID=A0A916X6X1_9SPHN|nr:hypothetical protein GCM10011494_30390 [Novosphingobium endophyticum]
MRAFKRGSERVGRLEVAHRNFTPFPAQLRDGRRIGIANEGSHAMAGADQSAGRGASLGSRSPRDKDGR